MTYQWLSAAGFRPDLFTPGGVDALVAILARSESVTQERVLLYLDHFHPELAERVRAALVTVADVLAMDPRALQKLITALAPRDLLLTLKTLDDGGRAQLLVQCSANRRARILDDLAQLGGVRRSEAEAARQAFVDTARRLEKAGEIVIRLPPGDEWVE